MRHLTALLLFTVGYLLTGSLDAHVAAAPALSVFALGAYKLAVDA